MKELLRLIEDKIVRAFIVGRDNDQSFNGWFYDNKIMKCTQQEIEKYIRNRLRIWKWLNAVYSCVLIFFILLLLL